MNVNPRADDARNRAGSAVGRAGCVMRLTLAAEPASVGYARWAVTDFARAEGMSASVLSDVELAVSEAVTNVVLHAYRDRSISGDVTIVADREGDSLRVLVSDRGDGIAPRADSPGLGLGLPVIFRLTRSVEIRDAPGGGAQVMMVFALMSADHPQTQGSGT